jgi:hypothetical protein
LNLILWAAIQSCRKTNRCRRALNKLIGDNDVIDAKTLTQVKMPNRDNFIMPYPDRL